MILSLTHPQVTQHLLPPHHPQTVPVLYIVVADTIATTEGAVMVHTAVFVQTVTRDTTAVK